MDARDKVEKLLALHKSVPKTPEGKNARRQALRLMKKHGWTDVDFRPKPVPKEPSRVWVMDPIGNLMGLRREPRSFDTELQDAVQGLKDLFRP